MKNDVLAENKIWSREEEIDHVIVQYCKNYFYPYALMLDGKWGSGKSYFIRNKIMDRLAKDTEVTPIYVSLYGLHTISELVDKVYMSMAEKKIGVPTIQLWRMVKPFIAPGISLQIGVPKESVDNLGGTLRDLFKDKILDMEKQCFIFDDFERCMIPMNELLGEISRMLEEYCAKILIVANESEIGFHHMQQNVELKTIAAALACPPVSETAKKKENENRETENVNNNIEKFRDHFFGEENAIYRKTKEKVVGQTLYYNPPVAEKIESVLEDMIQKICSEQAQFPKDFLTWIKEQGPFIVRLMDHYECRNLRILQFAVSRFMELEQYIKWASYDKKYVNALRANILYSAIHVSVQLRERQEQRRIWQPDETYAFNTIYPETTSFGEFASYVILKFVEDYIYDSYVDLDNIHKGLEQTGVLLISRDRKRDPLNSLCYYMELDGQGVICRLKSIYQNLKNGVYGLGDYLSILGLCQELSKIGFEEANIERWGDVIEENLKKGNVSEDAVGAVFGIRDENDPKYKTYIEEIQNYRLVQQVRPVEEQITNILDNDLSVDELEHVFQEDGAGLFSRGLFIKLPVKKLAVYLLRRPNREIYSFYREIRHQYMPENIKTYYQSDVEPLTEFADILEKQENEIADKMKKHNIEMLCKLIRGICDKMA